MMDFGGGAGMEDDGYARRGEEYLHDRPVPHRLERVDEEDEGWLVKQLPDGVKQEDEEGGETGHVRRGYTLSLLPPPGAHHEEITKASGRGGVGGKRWAAEQNVRPLERAVSWLLVMLEGELQKEKQREVHNLTSMVSAAHR